MSAQMNSHGQADEAEEGADEAAKVVGADREIETTGPAASEVPGQHAREIPTA